MEDMFPMMDHNPALAPTIGTRPKQAAPKPKPAAEVTGRIKKSFLRKKLPARLFSHIENREEFRILDYMPCTNRQPIDLHDPLRVRRSGRNIKLFLTITMYNEHADELRRSLKGVAEQLDQLHPHVTWEELAVAIVVDGRNKMHKSMVEFCSKELKIFDPQLLRLKHNGQEVTCHIFEKSVELSKYAAQREYYQPLQLILCIKERNGGKLNSHLWYFSGFCKQLQPTYTFLLDVGTEPEPYAFAKLYMAMENNPQLGGVCGEITVRKPKIYNLIEASQHFEYKISHVMDKAMESVFGYISVLPGAFSAYRWVAIRGEPLNQYFYVEEHSVAEMGPFMANMYLAEDRVLCFELLSKRNRNWTMHYVTGAIANTDVPTTLLELTKQRRRWLNGSFFSLVYYVTKFTMVLNRSDHGLWRRLALSVQFVYMLGLLVLNWLSVGSLYLSLVIIFSMAFDQIQTAAAEIMYFFTILYTFITMMQLIAGLGSKVNDVQKMYFVSAMVYGVIMMFALALSGWHLVTGKFSTTILIASAGAFSSYAFSALIHGQLPTTVGVFIQYMFMLPTFVNMFTIFSFCNMHDISWGTKEGNLQHEKARMTDGTQQTRMEELVSNLRDGGEAKAMAGVTEDDMRKVELLRNAVSTGNKEVDDIRRTALAFSKAAQKAMEERLQADVAKKQAALKKEEAKMKSEFSSFRTRLLTMWIISNWTYVTAVTHFDLVEFYAFLIAALIAFTLVFRLFGSIWYQAERIFKACWVVCCGWCCCTPFWMPPAYDEEDDDFSADSDEDRWMRGEDDREYDTDDGSFTGTESEGSFGSSGDTIHLDERPTTGRSRASRASRARSRASRARSRASRARSRYSDSGSGSDSRSDSDSRSGSGSDSDSRTDSGSDSDSRGGRGRSRGASRASSRLHSAPGRSRPSSAVSARGGVSAYRLAREAEKDSASGSGGGAGEDTGSSSSEGETVVERSHRIDISRTLDGAKDTSDAVLTRHASRSSRDSRMHSRGGERDRLAGDDVDEIITVETVRKVKSKK